MKAYLQGGLAGLALVVLAVVGPLVAELLAQVESLRTFSLKLSGALLFLLVCTLCLGWFIHVTWEHRARFHGLDRFRRWATVVVVLATIIVNFVEPGNGLAETLAISHIVLGFFHLQPA